MNICVLSYLQRIWPLFLILAQEMSPLSKLLYLYVIFSPVQESVGVSVENRNLRWAEHILNALITDAAERMYECRFS